MGLKFTNYLKLIFLLISVLPFQLGMAQICSITKFQVFPDSLNQKRNDTTVCFRSCLDLFAKVPPLRQTSSYAISNIPFIDSLPCEGYGAIPNGFSQPTNVHSPVVDMGFNFCFFGNTYSKCVISDNGYMSFDTTLAGNSSKYDLSTFPGVPTNGTIDYLNAIMGCCMDLQVTLNGEITTQTIGTAPYRVFIVKYNHCAYEGGSCAYPANELDMKMVLYETTNIIEIYIKKKTVCTSWNGGKAVQGIQDENGIIGYATTGRNCSQWSANNDAKRYTPNGATNGYTLKWYQGASVLGSNYLQTVCPPASGWYRCELTIAPYCGIAQPVTVSDSVYLNVKGSSSIANVVNVNDTVKCSSYFNVLDAGSGGIAYRWNTGSRNRFLNVAKEGIYYCSKVTDTSNCYFDSLRFDVRSEKVFLDSSRAYGCLPQSLGHLKVNGSGGKGTILYKIGNKSYSTNNIFDSLTYGSYHVKIKDSIGCEFDTLITLSRPGINIIQRNTCGLDSMGALVFDIRNFDGPYTFKMDTGAYKTDTIFNNVKGGTHNISIKNASGCIYDTALYAPFVSRKLAATYSMVKASGCFGGTPDGSITVNASGGNPPYRYSINYGTYRSSNYFGGLAEGGYFISIRDTFGCGIDSVVNVLPLAHLYVNGYVINASCFNTNTASIVITGLGGVPPYSFSFGGGSFSSVNTRTGLGAGTMTVTIKDARGCSVDTVLPIGQPPPLKFNPTLTNVSCYNGNNGQITINATGGVPPYMYSINGGTLGNNNVFSNLISGTYNLRLRDYNLCIKDTTVIITQPFPLNFFVTKTNTSCWNSSDGKFVFTGFGGNSPYQYSFNGSGFTTRNTYDTLAVGSYFVRIKDSKGCIRDSNVIIISPPKIVATLQLKGASCFGGTNGTIKVIAGGGTPPYFYSFENIGFTTIDSFTNIKADTYQVSIKDAKGCIFDTFAIVTQPALVTFNIGIKNVYCFGDSSGEITMGANGGTKPYKYAFENDTFSFNNSFKKKIIGTYSVHLKDANGCIYDTTVTITQPPILKMNIGVSHVSCFNGNNGSLNTIGVGGKSPYTYRVNIGAFLSATSHPNLTAGNYNITVLDSNGCTFDTTITITQPPRIGSQLFISNVNCFKGNDGFFKIRPFGGTPPYEFALDTAGYTNDSVFVNLKAGTYIVHTRDGNNCVVDTSLIISQPSKIITNSLVKNITCYNGNDGKLTITPGGGTGPYQCSTDSINYSNVFVFNNLIAGKYKYFIKDSKNCTYDTTVTVYQSTFITNGLIVKNVSCFNSNDGTIRVVATGGSKPYKYSFRGGAFDTISLFTNLPIGTYNIQTKDTFNCIKDTTVTLTQPPQVFVKATSINVQCYNAGNGYIEMSATGGVPPFTYALGTGLFSPNAKYYNLVPNTYKVYARDNLGCIRDTTIIITQPDSITFTYGVIDASCFEGSDGSLHFHVIGGTPPYLYSFDGGNYTTDTVQYGLKSRTYTVRIKDSNNCIQQRKIFVGQAPKPTLVPAEIIRATWDNDSTVLLQWHAYPKALWYKVESKFQVNQLLIDTFYYQKVPQSEIYEYRISVIDSCNFINQPSLVHNTLLLSGKMVDSKVINLKWNRYINWLNGIDYYNICRFNVLSNSWQIISTTIDTNFTLLVKPEDSLSEYIFYVEAIELNGNLAASVSNKVYLYTVPQVWMPNAFSPNNDGINELLFPKGLGVKSYTMSIYNRWGEKLFQTDDTHPGWDGKFEGVEVPVGTYIYEVQATCYLDKTVEKIISLKGAFQLIR